MISDNVANHPLYLKIARYRPRVINNGSARTADTIPTTATASEKATMSSKRKQKANHAVRKQRTTSSETTISFFNPRGNETSTEAGLLNGMFGGRHCADCYNCFNSNAGNSTKHLLFSTLIMNDEQSLLVSKKLFRYLLIGSDYARNQRNNPTLSGEPQSHRPDEGQLRDREFRSHP